METLKNIHTVTKEFKGGEIECESRTEFRQRLKRTIYDTIEQKELHSMTEFQLLRPFCFKRRLAQAGLPLLILMSLSLVVFIYEQDSRRFYNVIR